MLYQRLIADNQVLSAKLELHLRGSRYAGVGVKTPTSQPLVVSQHQSNTPDQPALYSEPLSFQRAYCACCCVRHEWGGEEFVIFYPTANRSTALEVAEELRRRIVELDRPHEQSLTTPHVIISIGVVSCVPEWELEFDPLLKASDDALYLSKTNGRNRITFGEVGAPDES